MSVKVPTMPKGEAYIIMRVFRRLDETAMREYQRGETETACAIWRLGYVDLNGYCTKCEPSGARYLGGEGR